MKILVTGANGLIGQHLVKRLLDEGHEVTAFVRKTSKLGLLKDLPDVNLAYGDVRDFDSLKKAMKDVEVVFHLAAVVHLPYKDRQTYYDINVTGTENVLKACSEEKSFKKLVHCSSVGCYAPSFEEIHEDSPCHSQSIYGKSKHEAEKIIKKFVKEHPLAYVMVRPARVYGPGDKTLLPLFKVVKKGRYFHMGKMDTKMMPIYVEDMAEAFVDCMEMPVENGEAFNIAGPRIVTTKEFMETIAKIMDKKIPKVSVPMPFVRFVALVTENVCGLLNKDPPISMKKLRFFTHSEKYSTKKAEKELGFIPKIEIEDGLKELYKWYKDNKLL